MRQLRIKETLILLVSSSQSHPYLGSQSDFQHREVVLQSNDQHDIGYNITVEFPICVRKAHMMCNVANVEYVLNSVRRKAKRTCTCFKERSQRQHLKKSSNFIIVGSI